MKRPPEHVREDVSRQILEKSIPPEWVLRDINPDYGIDKSLEIVEDDIVTGKEVFIQLKGTQTIAIHGDYVSFSIDTDHLKYYLEKDVPAFLIVVDLINKKCYWSFLQQYAYEILNVNNPLWIDQKTITIRIPIEQNVSDTLNQIVDIAKGGTAYIIARKINQIPNNHLTTWKTNAEAIIRKSQVADDFLEKSLHLQFDVSYHHEKEGNRPKSLEVLKKIYSSALAANNKKAVVKAGLLIVYQLNPYEQTELVWDWLNKISEFVEEVENNSYRLLWKGSIVETVYMKLIRDYFSLFTLGLVSSQNGRSPSLMTPYLIQQMQEKVQQLFKTEMDFVHCINKAYADEDFLLFLDFLKRLAKMHWLWVYTNSLKGNKDAIFKQLDSIENMLLFAKKLSEVISEDIKFMVLMDLAYLYNSMEKTSERDAMIEEAYALAKKLEHKGFIMGIKHAKEVFKKSPTIPYLINFEEKKTIKEPTFEEEEKHIKFLLKNAGIDIEGNDEFAKMARIGLKDRNPERILKHCKHLFTEIVNYGPIWDMVALPETGMKILYCDKKGAIMGYSLDDLLELFKKSNCKNCQYHSPRSNDWKWTRKWHRERRKPEGMIKTIENFFKH
jgi:hypothetical protein